MGPFQSFDEAVMSSQTMLDVMWSWVYDILLVWFELGLLSSARVLEAYYPLLVLLCLRV